MLRVRQVKVKVENKKGAVLTDTKSGAKYKVTSTAQGSKTVQYEKATKDQFFIMMQLTKMDF